jgi:biopolymer transport protein ExbD
MRICHLFAAAVFLSSPCLAVNTAVKLHILPNGHVRFESGPELDEVHLAIKIRELMRQNPRPEIRLLGDKQVKYNSVAAVLAAFQRAGYGPHFGLAVLTN